MYGIRILNTHKHARLESDGWAVRKTSFHFQFSGLGRKRSFSVCRLTVNYKRYYGEAVLQNGKAWLMK